MQLRARGAETGDQWLCLFSYGDHQVQAKNKKQFNNAPVT